MDGRAHARGEGRPESIVAGRWRAERNANNEIVEVLESNVDITERMLAEARLRDEDRRKNEFLATLSHELRNPLAPIRYALALLTQDGDGDGNARARRVIERQLSHLVRLVDDLLDLTRIASNKVRLRREPVTVSEIVEQAVDSVMPQLQSAKHTLEVSLPNEAVWVDGDAVRLTQVFTNLLSNAVRYTPAGGLIRVSATATPDTISVSVSDTGVGLKGEDLRRVFDMFAQVGEPGLGGLGIGLALVKGLVEMHGGTVTASSDGPGHGCEFRVTLPRQAGPKPTAAGLAARGADGRPTALRRVLVVDDNVDSADMMKTLLELDGHQVAVAYDGTTALKLADSMRPDVGLFDIGLPGMSGYELAQRLRTDPAHREMYLVAVTGWGQDGDRERARQSGFDAHLTKPPAPEAIRALLERCQRRERAV